ncbi:aromatic ring-hydroxylating dioxygenase subunit alpha [soil metagenome]
MGLPAKAPISSEAMTKVLMPFGRSFTMPAAAYVSPDVFAWERKSFFEDTWVCVGRADDLANAGDRRAVQVGSEGVVLVRDERGTLNGFYNVCRHRGHQLVEPGECTSGRVLRCPYHAWVYGLDGVLKGAPRFSDRPGFDRADFPLTPARVAEWHGWVFVNASGDAPRFDDHVGNLGDMVADHEPERLVSAVRHDYVIESNWKIITENYHECYHCPQIHPELCRVSPPDSGYNMDPSGAWAGGTMELMAHADTMSLSGASEGVTLRGLDDRRRREVLYFGLFPNLLISLHPDYVMTHRIVPLAHERSFIECEWLFPPEALATEGFDPSYAADFWDITNKQDWGACESVQRGAGSRGHRQGPLASAEDAVYQFITMVARGYMGELPLGPARRAPPTSLGSEQAS